MKSRKEEVPDKPVKYPCLKEDKDLGLVVLFTSTKTGIAVNAGSSAYDLAFRATDWPEERFEDFDGSIILSN